MNKIIFIGSRIGHSLLPLVYQLINESMDLHLKVINIELTPGEFIAFMKEKQYEGFKFCCITFPYKVLAATLVNFLNPRGFRSNSINIIYLNNAGHLIGDNTDGEGLFNDLVKRLKFDVYNKNILVLGNGGVSRGIVPILFHQGAKLITICQRKAQPLVELNYNVAMSFCTYEEVPTVPYHLVLNTTSASIYNEIPSLQLTENLRHAFFYECAYARDEKTSFEKYLNENQIFHYSNGIGMLIEQAAIAIRGQFGVEVNTKEIFYKLMNIIQNNVSVSS